MGVLDLVPFARSILPPADEADGDAMRSWRLNHSITLLFVTAALSVHIAWACGFIPGLYGFAHAGELMAVSKQVKETQLTLLDQSIMEARRNECRFTKQNNKDGAQFAASRLRALLSQWHDLSTHEYLLPTCDEVI